jgi:hypothetical protein
MRKSVSSFNLRMRRSDSWNVIQTFSNVGPVSASRACVIIAHHFPSRKILVFILSSRRGNRNLSERSSVMPFVLDKRTRTHEKFTGADLGGPSDICKFF